MNRNELKEYIKQRKEAIYSDEKFKDLSKFCLFNPDYKKRNPLEFLHKYPDRVHPVKLSKSFAQFYANDILCKMHTVAQQLNYIVVPVKIFHWKRRAKVVEQYPHFQASKYSYVMLPQCTLNDRERRALIDYIRELDWTS